MLELPVNLEELPFNIHNHYIHIIITNAIFTEENEPHCHVTGALRKGTPLCYEGKAVVVAAAKKHVVLFAL